METIIGSVIGSVSALLGGFAGAWFSFRQLREQMLEDRRRELRQALDTFARNSNESHTLLLERVSETEAANIEMLGGGLESEMRNRKFQAEVNRITGFINRYLGDLRGEALGLQLMTNNETLLTALRSFDDAIGEAFSELVVIGDRQAAEGERFTREFNRLGQDYLALTSNKSPISDSTMNALNSRKDQLSNELDQSFRAWRSSLLKAAVSFRTDREIVNVVEAGKKAVDDTKQVERRCKKPSAQRRKKKRGIG